MNKKKRPTSITVIAWIIIIWGGLSLVAMLLTSRMPEMQQALEAAGISVAFSILCAIVGFAISAVSGIAILKGLNWGRLLYLCYVPISIIFEWGLYGFDPGAHIPAIIFYLVVLTILTRPAASAFFRSRFSI